MYRKQQLKGNQKMSQDVRHKLETSYLFDNGIIEHHFTPYLRDYDIIVEVQANTPNGQGYIEGRYLFRFTHCVLAKVTTAVSDRAWQVSWGDVYIDYKAWEEAGEPEGYVWGVCYSDVYPGLTYIEQSPLAEEWSMRLGHTMHEIFIETNGHNIRLVFHDVIIRKIAQGNPETKQLTML